VSNGFGKEIEIFLLQILLQVLFRAGARQNSFAFDGMSRRFGGLFTEARGGKSGQQLIAGA
jgi:hypothetical protein